MPFVSQAQQGWAHTHPKEFGKKNLEEFDSATKGMHNLPEHKGNKMSDDKKKKHNRKYHRTEIEHHSDGSHTVRHHPHFKKETMDPQEDPIKSYAASDMSSLHSGLDQNLMQSEEPAPEPA